MTNYQEIIQKNIKELKTNGVDIIKWHTQSLISYLEEENKRLEESKYDDWDGADNIDVGFNRAINEQVEHNKNVIGYIKGL
ncbi:MAG: hypothetical protein KBB16_03695 [Candidatus Pacebacteria bacterium]|nr:hypothetical protein [Candidatus Paceibacterota bacterium]